MKIAPTSTVCFLIFNLNPRSTNLHTMPELNPDDFLVRMIMDISDATTFDTLLRISQRAKELAAKSK